MPKYDRDYYRALEDKLLVEAGFDSKHELSIALAERLDDAVALSDPAALYRQIYEMEHEISYLKGRVSTLQHELEIYEKDANQ